MPRFRACAVITHQHVFFRSQYVVPFQTHLKKTRTDLFTILNYLSNSNDQCLVKHRLKICHAMLSHSANGTNISPLCLSFSHSTLPVLLFISFYNSA